MKFVQSNVCLLSAYSFNCNRVLYFSAEKAVNERLAHTPELYLLALAQFAITADTEVVSLSSNPFSFGIDHVVDAVLLACSPSSSAF